MGNDTSTMNSGRASTDQSVDPASRRDEVDSVHASFQTSPAPPATFRQSELQQKPESGIFDGLTWDLGLFNSKGGELDRNDPSVYDKVRTIFQEAGHTTRSPRLSIIANSKSGSWASTPAYSAEPSPNRVYSSASTSPKRIYSNASMSPKRDSDSSGPRIGSGLGNPTGGGILLDSSHVKGRRETRKVSFEDSDTSDNESKASSAASKKSVRFDLPVRTSSDLSVKTSSDEHGSESGVSVDSVLSPSSTPKKKKKLWQKVRDFKHRLGKTREVQEAKLKFAEAFPLCSNFNPSAVVEGPSPEFLDRISLYLGTCGLRHDRAKALALLSHSSAWPEQLKSGSLLSHDAQRLRGRLLSCSFPDIHYGSKNVFDLILVRRSDNAQLASNLMIILLQRPTDKHNFVKL